MVFYKGLQMLHEGKIPPLILWFIGTRIYHLLVPTHYIRKITEETTKTTFGKRDQNSIFWMKYFVFQVKCSKIRLVNWRIFFYYTFLHVYLKYSISFAAAVNRNYNYSTLISSPWPINFRLKYAKVPSIPCFEMYVQCLRNANSW